MLSWRLLPHSGRKFHVREVTPFYKAAPQREHREPRTIPNRGEGGEGGLEAWCGHHSLTLEKAGETGGGCGIRTVICVRANTHPASC